MTTLAEAGPDYEGLSPAPTLEDFAPADQALLAEMAAEQGTTPTALLYERHRQNWLQRELGASNAEDLIVKLENNRRDAARLPGALRRLRVIVDRSNMRRAVIARLGKWVPQTLRPAPRASRRVRRVARAAAVSSAGSGDSPAPEPPPNEGWRRRGVW